MRIFIHIAILIISAQSIDAAQDKMETLTKELQQNPQLFDEITIQAPDQPTDFQVELGKTTLTLPSGDQFDGFRFTAPKDSHSQDFTWYFNAPNEWGHWYISPVQGALTPAFKSWLDADNLYRRVDSASPVNRLRVLQTLGAGYFKDGSEYIIWFRHVEKGGGTKLTGRFIFNKIEKKNDYAELEKTLQLKPQAAPAQVKSLKSRGGKILLDKAFFKPSYAANRIDSVFFSIRQTKRMKGGFFITMQITVPPCDTEPSYAQIRKKYGAADFIQTSAEANRVRKHAGGDIDEEDDNSVTTYYYDYFGFEVATGDKKETVLGVVTHANNFSTLRNKSVDASYGQIPMKNLTVLHKGDQEVGRLYYFLEGGKKPLCTLEPPVGKYQQGQKILEYLGNKKWLWLTLRNDGSTARTIPFTQDLMNGKAQGVYSNGKPSFIAHYLNGVLDGKVIQYSKEGEITSESIFKKGQRIDE